MHFTHVLWAVSTYSPVGSRSSKINGACVDEMNLKYALHWNPNIISFHTMPVYTHKHMHTCFLKPFEDSEPMGF